MELDLLSKIKHVEAPPFLFTRIQQKIESAKRQKVPMGVALVVQFSLAVLLVVNLYIAAGEGHTKKDTEIYAEFVDLTFDNTIYK